MNNDIKAIIFDWGGVCCREGEPFASKALQKYLNLTPDEITEKVKSIYDGYYIGEYDRDSFWGKIIDFFKIKEDPKINPVALSDAYLNSYEIYQDVLNLILKLKERYKVGLLSNLTPEMKYQIQNKHHTKNYFDLEVYSCDHSVRSIKPNYKPFKIILNKIGFPAEKCLFIDNSQKNIEAAASIGMKTLLFKDRDQFFKDIEEKFIGKI